MPSVTHREDQFSRSHKSVLQRRTIRCRDRGRGADAGDLLAVSGLDVQDDGCGDPAGKPVMADVAGAGRKYAQRADLSILEAGPMGRENRLPKVHGD